MATYTGWKESLAAAVRAGARRSEVGARRARGAVTLTWDDGIDTIYTMLYPMLRDLYPHQRHTFALVSDNIGTTGRMTPAQIVELHAAGHEIASHSKSHTRMTDVPLPADRVTQYDGSKAAIEAILGHPITTWVYPYGQSARSITTDREVLSRYERLVSSDFAGAIVRLAERDHVITVPRRPDWTTSTQAEVLELIRLAASQPVIVNIMGHAPGTSMTAENLAEGLALIDQLGVPVLSMEEAYPAGSLLMNPSAENGAACWTKVGAGVFESVTDTPAPGIAGAKSFHVTNLDDATTTFVYQVVPVTPGETYTLSGQVRTNITSGLGARFRVQPYQLGEQTAGVARVAGTYVNSATWVGTQQTYTVPPNTVSLRLDFAVEASTGEAWFDNLHFGPTRFGAFGG